MWYQIFERKIAHKQKNGMQIWLFLSLFVCFGIGKESQKFVYLCVLFDFAQKKCKSVHDCIDKIGMKITVFFFFKQRKKEKGALF